MSETLKNKPFRELLEDIKDNRPGAFTPPRGLIRPKLVARITFFTSLACLVFTSATVLAVIWEYADPMFSLRCIGSTMVVLIALFVFRAINEQFD